MSDVWRNEPTATSNGVRGRVLSAMFDSARRGNHSRGLPWTDPTTGFTFLPPKKRKKVKKGRKGRR